MLVSYLRPFSKISRAVLGPLQTNCYFYQNHNHCLIVDPADNSEQILSWLNDKFPGNKKDIFLTHGHVDHTFAAAAVCAALNSPNNTSTTNNNEPCQIFCSKKDSKLFFDEKFNFSIVSGQSTSLNKVEKYMKYVEDSDLLKFGDCEMSVFGIGGHTPGSIALYSPKDQILFSGDTLFMESIGTAHGEGHDFWEMIRNIKNKLLKLPEETHVLPGHGPETTIGHEKSHNTFLEGDA